MRISLLAALALFVAQPAFAQDDPFKTQPKRPPSKKEQQRLEAEELYVDGLKLERAEKFLEALKLYQDAAKLDPESPRPLRAQIAILLGMDRLRDATEVCTRVVALDPQDYRTWCVLAKLHKSAIRYADAVVALEGAVKTTALRKNPEVAQAIYTELGGLYENTEKFALAAEAYQKAVEILEQPDGILAKEDFPKAFILAQTADTCEKIAELYRKAKRHEDAVAALAKAQKHVPDRMAPLNYTIAQIRVEQGDLKSALRHVDAYLDTRPLSADPYQTKIDILRGLKQPADILPWLESAAERERHNGALQLLLAREFAAAKQPKKAEAIYKKQIEDAPTADAYRGLFHLFKNARAMALVLDLLDKMMDQAAKSDGPVPANVAVHAKAMMAALRDDPDLAAALVDVGVKQPPQLKFDTVYFLAIVAERYRKTEEAETFYRQCLKSTAPGNESLIYGGLLRVLGKTRKHAAVVAICEHGLKNAKSTTPLLFHSDAARAFAGLHRYDDALKQADQGLDRAGVDQKLVFRRLRIQILAMAERFEQAETECQVLLKGNDRPGEIIELRYLLSNIYGSAKQSAKSEEQLTLILKIDPQNVVVSNDLGYLWADQGKNLEQAEDMIRRAIELDRLQRRRNPALTPAQDKDNAAYVDSLGWVLFRRGQIEAARKELERAATLDDGDDPVIFDHLGDVYHSLRMPGEANRAWQRALQLYEVGLRRKDDERVRDLHRKIGQVKSGGG